MQQRERFEMDEAVADDRLMENEAFFAATQRLSSAECDMVEANTALVWHIVSRMAERFPSHHDRNDLVQAGMIGLIEASRRFDESRGFSFSTFAGRRIQGAVLDVLRADDWAPRSVRDFERSLNDAESILATRLGRRPTDAELQRVLEVDQERLRAARADMDRATLDSLERRLDAPTDRGQTPTQIGDASRTPAPDEQVEHVETLEFLRKGVDLLPERHRLIVVGHFFEGKTMTELGEFLGVTQSRASQLKNEALTLLREGFKSARDGDDVPETLTRHQKSYVESFREASRPATPAFARQHAV